MDVEDDINVLDDYLMYNLYYEDYLYIRFWPSEGYDEHKFLVYPDYMQLRIEYEKFGKNYQIKLYLDTNNDVHKYIVSFNYKVLAEINKQLPISYFLNYENGKVLWDSELKVMKIVDRLMGMKAFL
jgi:hypothetical protein